MTLLQDKRQRTLILTTIFLLSFLLVGMFALNLLQEQRIQHLALTRTNAMVSALLEDGVPADVCGSPSQAGIFCKQQFFCSRNTEHIPHGDAAFYLLYRLSAASCSVSFCPETGIPL